MISAYYYPVPPFGFCVAGRSKTVRGALCALQDKLVEEAGLIFESRQIVARFRRRNNAHMRVLNVVAVKQK